MVRTERLELSHLAAPEPKSGVSTNSTTSAHCIFLVSNYVEDILLKALSIVNGADGETRTLTPCGTRT